LGGLSKKGWQIKQISSDAGQPRLTLDAGNLLFKHAAITPNLEAQEKLTAEAIVAAYNLIGYQAVCVGGKDLIAGIPYLQRINKNSKFPWLSANLVKQPSRKPIFKASTIIKVGALKAGVIGLTGPAMLQAEDAALILPWEEVLPTLIAKVAKKSDLVILLSNLPAADNQRIAQEYGDIHLIIQSGANANTLSPEPVNNTLLVSTGPQGKQLGIMTIHWQRSKRWGDTRAETLRKKSEAMASMRWQLSKYQQDQDPETALRNQPDQLQAYHLLKAREQAMQNEIDRLSQELGQNPPAQGTPSSFANRFMAMEIGLPDQKEVVRITDQLAAAIVKQGQQQAKSNTSTAISPYLGSNQCGACHAAQLASWQQTKHASAYTTLVNGQKQFNQNCLPCHVTGVTLAQGQEALSLPAERRGVGCETCHGPGREHSKSPKAFVLTRIPGPAVCQSCHSAPHDEAFDYQVKIKQVGH